MYNIEKQPLEILYDEEYRPTAARFDKFGRLLYQVFDRFDTKRKRVYSSKLKNVYNRKRKPLRAIYDLQGRPRSTVYDRQGRKLEPKFDKSGRPVAYLFDKQGIPLYDAEGKPWTEVPVIDLEDQNELRKNKKAKTLIATRDDVNEIKDSIKKLREQILLVHLSEKKSTWAMKHEREHKDEKRAIYDEVQESLAHVLQRIDMGLMFPMALTQDWVSMGLSLFPMDDPSEFLILKTSKSLSKSRCLKKYKINFSHESLKKKPRKCYELREDQFRKKVDGKRNNIHDKSFRLTSARSNKSILKTPIPLSKFRCIKRKEKFSLGYNTIKVRSHFHALFKKKSRKYLKMRKESQVRKRECKLSNNIHHKAFSMTAARSILETSKSTFKSRSSKGKVTFSTGHDTNRNKPQSPIEKEKRKSPEFQKESHDNGFIIAPSYKSILKSSKSRMKTTVSKHNVTFSDHDANKDKPNRPMKKKNRVRLNSPKSAQTSSKSHLTFEAEVANVVKILVARELELKVKKFRDYDDCICPSPLDSTKEKLDLLKCVLGKPFTHDRKVKNDLTLKNMSDHIFPLIIDLMAKFHCVSKRLQYENEQIQGALFDQFDDLKILNMKTNQTEHFDNIKKRLTKLNTLNLNVTHNKINEGDVMIILDLNRRQAEDRLNPLKEILQQIQEDNANINNTLQSLANQLKSMKEEEIKPWENILPTQEDRIAARRFWKCTIGCFNNIQNYINTVLTEHIMDQGLYIPKHVKSPKKLHVSIKHFPCIELTNLKACTRFLTPICKKRNICLIDVEKRKLTCCD